jgi:hypothetical protein
MAWVRELYIDSRCPWSIAAALVVTFVCDAERVTYSMLKRDCLTMLTQAAAYQQCRCCIREERFQLAFSRSVIFLPPKLCTSNFNGCTYVLDVAT